MVVAQQDQEMGKLKSEEREDIIGQENKTLCPIGMSAFQRCRGGSGKPLAGPSTAL